MVGEGLLTLYGSDFMSIVNIGKLSSAFAAAVASPFSGRRRRLGGCVFAGHDTLRAESSTERCV